MPPNCEVIFKGGFTVHVYVSPDQLQRASRGRGNSHNEELIDMHRMRSGIAAHIAGALRKKYPDMPHRYVNWADLKIRAMPTDHPAASMPVTVPVTVPRSAEVECDDCTSCDLGYHERCSNSCPLARRPRHMTN